jgi:hypothetical protein
MPQRPLDMVKRQISFSRADFEWLLGEAGYAGVSVSELVRRYVSDRREVVQSSFNEIITRAKKKVR